MINPVTSLAGYLPVIWKKPDKVLDFQGKAGPTVASCWRHVKRVVLHRAPIGRDMNRHNFIVGGTPAYLRDLAPVPLLDWDLRDTVSANLQSMVGPGSPI